MCSLNPRYRLRVPMQNARHQPRGLKLSLQKLGPHTPSRNAQNLMRAFPQIGSLPRAAKPDPQYRNPTHDDGGYRKNDEVTTDEDLEGSTTTKPPSSRSFPPSTRHTQGFSSATLFIHQPRHHNPPPPPQIRKDAPRSFRHQAIHRDMPTQRCILYDFPHHKY